MKFINRVYLYKALGVSYNEQGSIQDAVNTFNNAAGAHEYRSIELHINNMMVSLYREDQKPRNSLLSGVALTNLRLKRPPTFKDIQFYIELAELE